jgi:hypothetical protein
MIDDQASARLISPILAHSRENVNKLDEVIEHILRIVTADNWKRT